MDTATLTAWTTIIAAVGAVISAVLTHLGNLRVARVHAETKEVHFLVNSERDAMKKELGLLRDQLAAVTAALALEKQAGRAGAAGVAANVSAAVDAVAQKEMNR